MSEKTVIKKQDFIDSVTNALQYISFYHPPQFIKAMHQAYEAEVSPAAKNAIAQILINSRMAAEGHRPICQDTGMVCALLEVGMDVQWDSDLSLQEMVDEAVRTAYMDSSNPLRASVVADPAGARKNTRDNTPAVVSVDLVKGNQVKVTLMAKGFGSEFKSKMTILNPSDSVVEWVLEQIPKMGAGWCPPGVLGVGIGGTADKVVKLAKHALVEDQENIQDLIKRGPETTAEKLRVELYEKINALGIGAQGLGGLTTVLDVKVDEFPTHAAGLPVAIIPNCAATRYVTIELDGSGPCELAAPSLDDWPVITDDVSKGSKRLNLDNITKEDIADLKSGDTLLLSGKILTGRDAAHRRIQQLLESGESLPEGVDFTNRFIYYVGPVPKVGEEVIGPAGPTTATRMDKFSDMMLGELGLLGIIGKAERGPATVECIKQNKGIYCSAVGGSAYLISQAIKSSRLVAFEDLGMEAIYEFEVEDMPVTVAVDPQGQSVHVNGPAEWRVKIEDIKRS